MSNAYNEKLLAEWANELEGNTTYRAWLESSLIAARVDRDRLLQQLEESHLY